MSIHLDAKVTLRAVLRLLSSRSKKASEDQAIFALERFPQKNIFDQKIYLKLASIYYETGWPFKRMNCSQIICTTYSDFSNFEKVFRWAVSYEAAEGLNAGDSEQLEKIRPYARLFLGIVAVARDQQETAQLHFSKAGTAHRLDPHILEAKASQSTEQAELYLNECIPRIWETIREVAQNPLPPLNPPLSGPYLLPLPHQVHKRRILAPRGISVPLPIDPAFDEAWERLEGKGRPVLFRQYPSIFPIFNPPPVRIGSLCFEEILSRRKQLIKACIEQMAHGGEIKFRGELSNYANHNRVSPNGPEGIILWAQAFNSVMTLET